MQHQNTKIPQHKYAINASMLGDDTALPWTNLGLWHTPHVTYPEACQNLAISLAEALALKSDDAVLDLGCGWGASLNLWQEQYAVRQISAVELQTECLSYLKTQDCLNTVNFYQGSFLNLKALSLNLKHDVILCIDALYHHSLPQFLNSISASAHEETRLGFHYLTITAQWEKLSFVQRKKYQYLLALADIQINALYSQTQLCQVLENAGWHHTDIKILTEPVFGGFSSYIQHREHENHAIYGIDGLKIKLTAKLCHQLFKAGIVDYVQVVSHRLP